ncbi:MAG: sigma factor-like helix-turn-helix DNA-binding protein [Ilumatobacteraceae bacterium]
MGDREAERTADPADHAIDRWSAADAVALVAEHLPPEQAEVVLLRVVGGLDVASVAEIVGRTPWLGAGESAPRLQRLAAVVTPLANGAGR